MCHFVAFGAHTATVRGQRTRGLRKGVPVLSGLLLGFQKFFAEFLLLFAEGGSEEGTELKFGKESAEESGGEEEPAEEDNDTFHGVIQCPAGIRFLLQFVKHDPFPVFLLFVF